MLPPMRGLSLPAYHEDLLLIKVKPSAATFATPAMGGLIGAAGFSVLATLERGGFIRRVIPLGPQAGPPSFSATAMLAGSAANFTRGPSALAGVSLIELEPGTDSKQLRMAMAGDPNIDSVSLVPVRYLMARARKRAVKPAPPPATPADTPPTQYTLWNLDKIKWREAIAAGLGLADAVHVAVLDTGIDLGHPDLPGGEVTYVHDYTNGPSTTDRDIVGHGTHVSGTIRALIDNQIGINGISACKLSVYKIFSDETTYIPPPYGDYFAYTVDPILYRKALAAALDDGVQVINLSIGGPGVPDHVEAALFQALIDGGVSVVAAMGNENSSDLSYPAAIPGVIAVGATTISDARANFSNYGSHIALCAPGAGIWSTIPTYPGQTGFYRQPGSDPAAPGQPIPRPGGTDYGHWDGTSMASPHVAAAAALALGKHGVMSPAAMKTLLMAAADKVPGMNGADFTSFYGAGRLNLLKL
jgi:subtilisin family serine protease